MRSTCLTRCFLPISLCVVFSPSAFAQYGTGGGRSSSSGGTISKGGYRSTTAIGIGAAAVAALGATYFALHKQAMVVGCVEASAEGKKLMNEKDQHTYSLPASSAVTLMPGERVKLKGKKARDDSGKLTFQPEKIMRNYGSCRQ